MCYSRHFSALYITKAHRPVQIYIYIYMCVCVCVCVRVCLCVCIVCYNISIFSSILFQDPFPNPRFSSRSSYQHCVHIPALLMTRHFVTGKWSNYPDNVCIHNLKICKECLNMTNCRRIQAKELCAYTYYEKVITFT